MVLIMFAIISRVIMVAQEFASSILELLNTLDFIKQRNLLGLLLC